MIHQEFLKNQKIRENLKLTRKRLKKKIKKKKKKILYRLHPNKINQSRPKRPQLQISGVN